MNILPVKIDCLGKIYGTLSLQTILSGSVGYNLGKYSPK